MGNHRRSRLCGTSRDPQPAQAEHQPALPRRSEEHTSELQSHLNLVCRLLLEKKKKLPSSIQTHINYTFNCIEVWRQCQYLFSNSSRLLLENNHIHASDTERQTVLDYVYQSYQ